jgi:V/A-type H+/Na+-transporting ATPase subunit I
MLFTAPMKRVELAVLKADVDSVVRYLGTAGCLQLITEGREQREASSEEKEIADLQVKVLALSRFLGDDGDAGTAAPPQIEAPDREALSRRAASLLDDARELLEVEHRLVQRRLELKKAEEELSDFSRLTVSFSDLNGLRHLIWRAGSVAPESLDGLVRRLEKRAQVVALDRPGHILALAPRKGRWALDSELKRAGFQETGLPSGVKGVPSEALAAVRADLVGVEGALAGLEGRKKAFLETRGPDLRFARQNLTLAASIDTLKQGFASTGSVQQVSGWIPRRRFDEVAKGLESITKGRLALQSQDPEELPDVKSGKAKVPVFTPHRRITRSFERMVFSYSVPLYGTIDPTPFVAVMFVLLFAIMFGDVGQGFVGVALGLLISSGRVRAFEGYRTKNFGTAFVVAGAASMFTGFLYGSFFANENVLIPVSRFLSRLFIGRPLDHIISLEGFQKIILFFGVTVGIGAVINSIGLLMNIANCLRRRDWEKALLNKTGLAGAVFFWYVLFVAVRVVLGGKLSGIDFVFIGVPLLALFFREPIVRLAEGHRPVLKDGVFAFVMEGIVEILESAIYYVSNSVSFLRVAAFALAHTVLSTIVFLLAGMVGGAPGGIAFKILVILIGNAIIIVLEGLIVTIQVVRLQYYEFFSKFFTETGEEFKPFTLRSLGGSR